MCICAINFNSPNTVYATINTIRNYVINCNNTLYTLNSTHISNYVQYKYVLTKGELYHEVFDTHNIINTVNNTSRM